jgi:hypothetical protein
VCAVVHGRIGVSIEEEEEEKEEEEKKEEEEGRVIIRGGGGSGFQCVQLSTDEVA